MSWRDLQIEILEEFAAAAALSARRCDYRELPSLAEVYSPERRRLKHLRNLRAERASSLAYATKTYHDVLKHDPAYRKAAAEKARAYYARHKTDPLFRARRRAMTLAWQRANRDTRNARRRARRAERKARAPS